MGILTVPVRSEPLGAALARQLLNQHGDALPDLSGLIVLVPNHRAGQDFARTLARAAGGNPLIPPRITPLKAWAENVADGAAEPPAQRLARLHGVLRQQAWLGQVDKWALAQELLTLADELSAARLGGEIAGRIRALQTDTLDRETALIEAVWRTLNQDDNDPQTRYARALHTLDRACHHAAQHHRQFNIQPCHTVGGLVAALDAMHQINLLWRERRLPVKIVHHHLGEAFLDRGWIRDALLQHVRPIDQQPHIASIEPWRQGNRAIGCQRQINRSRAVDPVFFDQRHEHKA